MFEALKFREYRIFWIGNSTSNIGIFMLMLQPISELNNTSPEELKLALSAMSSGMAVALYTTLTGLISSILIRLEFQIASANVATLINELSFYTEE